MFSLVDQSEIENSRTNEGTCLSYQCWLFKRQDYKNSHTGKLVDTFRVNDGNRVIGPNEMSIFLRVNEMIAFLGELTYYCNLLVFF